jgi:hypothetical protein
MCLRIGRKLQKSLIKILNMKKEFLRKFSPFLNTFFGGGKYGGGR